MTASENQIVVCQPNETVRFSSAARMLAHPSGSAFAESSLRNAFAFLRRIYRFRSRGTRDPTRRVTVAAWRRRCSLHYSVALPFVYSSLKFYVFVALNRFLVSPLVRGMGIV